MYLTSHRVKKQNKMGINVFLHKHKEIEVPDMSWSKPDIELIADNYPGVLVAESINLAPGGNQVMSFLDVVAEDSTDSDSIETALERFENEVSEVRKPLIQWFKGIGIRFGLQSGLGDQTREEYAELKDRALSLLKNPTIPVWRSKSPLLVDVSISEQEWTFSLASDSVQRIKEIHQEPWKPNRVTIRHETKHDFEQIHGDVIRHIIPVLTDLDVEQIAALGGVRLHNVSTSEVLEWPKR